MRDWRIEEGWNNGMLECQGMGLGVNNHPKKGWLGLTLKGSLISHPSTMHGTYGASRAHGATEHENLLQNRLLTLPLWGLQSRYAGLCMGKVLKEKKECILFS